MMGKRMFVKAPDNKQLTTNVAGPEEVRQQQPESIVQGGQHVPPGGLAHKEVRPFVIPDTIVSSGTVIASSLRRVEVVYDDILAMDEALQTDVGASTEVGKHHRGRPLGRGNSHGVVVGQTSLVNLEKIATAMVGNRNKDVRPGTFSPRLTRSKRGAS
ncbi:hypothetical protein NE237_027538 [Protea cynaroides]|uniref:Uncharacterized protein n=1 Tax=Protea cynaroides TaxID=273540 RepID=A0A9Q0GMQ6_9MAGN|nr:hypothetical protein NE237_027538 [Protea cynaroides]